MSQSKTEQQALAIRRVHAPMQRGFQALDPQQFTYFSGAGARDSFGMPCEAYSSLVLSFIEKHQEGGAIRAILLELQHTIRRLTTDRAAGRIYRSNEEMVAALIKNTGHIPIMLSTIFPAAMYERSARSIEPLDVALYFRDYPGAATQARDYLIKHDMTQAVKQCLDKLCSLRYQVEGQEGTSFYDCNRVILELTSEVIEENQKTMPQNCVQFDLFEIFCKKMSALVNECDTKLIPKAYLDRILQVLNSKGGMPTFTAQQRASAEMYRLLEEMLLQLVGIKKDAAEINLTKDQDKQLQAILPFIAYLNSEYNPFARAGLFGQEIHNSFTAEALKEYERHESQEKAAYETFMYRFKPNASPREYDEAQMDHLLFGPEDSAPQAASSGGMFASLTNTLMNMLTDSATAAKEASNGAERSNRLALPVPDKFLAIEAPPPNSHNTFSHS